MKYFDFDTAWEELFEEGLPESFTFGELFDKMVEFNHGVLPEEKDTVLDRIAESLLGTDEYFLKGMGDTGYAVSRRSFFKGTLFKILPDASEIRKGILLCGARFVPFVSPEIFADEYELVTSEKGAKPFRTKTCTGLFADYCKPYLLLGKSETLDTLVAECDENYEEIRSVKSLDRAKVKISAYDIGAFYRKHDFRIGDGIIVKVLDWESGKFSLEYCPGAKLPGEEDKEKFLTSFEDGIAETFKIFGEYQPPCDQIAYAYFFASGNTFDLRKTPALSLDEYPARMRDIAVNRDDAEWFLMPVESDDYEYSNVDESFEQPEEECSCGHHHHHHHHEDGEECSCHDHHHGYSGIKTELSEEEKEELYAHEEGVADPRIPRHFSLSKGRMDSLEGILDDIHSPVPYVEIYGMLLDFLANGGEDFKAFFEILSGEMGTEFVDEAQEAAFLNFLEEVWEDAVERFNPVHENTKMTLRSRVLALTASHRAFASELLHKYKGKVPKEIILEMKSIHGRLMDTLGVINADTSLPEGEEYEQLELRIGDLEDEWDDLCSMEE